jgi:type IV secretory pathway ATPase VirB11/archaellum biosynthesis ATPase
MRFWFASKEFNDKFENFSMFLKKNYPEAYKKLEKIAKQEEERLGKKFTEDNPNYKFELKKAFEKKFNCARQTEEQKTHQAELKDLEDKLKDL